MDSSKFMVNLYKKEVVSAASPWQERRLCFSNLDLLLPPLDVGVFFCYKKPTTTTSTTSNGESFTFASMVTTLKKAMAQALTPYYAFAGEVVSNSKGELELLCNNRGVDFLEAYADVELRHLQIYNPDATVEGKLLPKKTDGVFSVQVTELRCGGIVVGCTFDHRIADAYSANMFFVAWAEIAQTKAISFLPSFDRSLLSPRWPGWYGASVDNMYVSIQMLPPPRSHNRLTSRIYYIKAIEIERLQSLANCNGALRSKFESFSAFLWQRVAKAAENKAKRCKMGIVVNGRSRISSTGEKCDRTFLMSTYFGNVLSIPFAEKSVDELITKPLCWVADVVHEFLEGAVTKDHFLQLIDWVETNRTKQAVAKIYCHGSEDGVAFVVSSGQQFPVSKVDFGWGRPAFGSYHFPWGGEAGYVMPMPSSSGNGDWVVYMHLLEEHLELIEAEAADVFKPLTYDYLNLVAKD